MHGIRYKENTILSYQSKRNGFQIIFFIRFLALVHDLAESIVGDITPYCGVSKEEKRMREMNAMQDIVKLIAPRGQRLMELFEVY